MKKKVIISTSVLVLVIVALFLGFRFSNGRLAASVLKIPPTKISDALNNSAVLISSKALLSADGSNSPNYVRYWGTPPGWGGGVACFEYYFVGSAAHYIHLPYVEEGGCNQVVPEKLDLAK